MKASLAVLLLSLAVSYATHCLHGDVSLCTSIVCLNPGENITCVGDVCTCDVLPATLAPPATHAPGGGGHHHPCTQTSDCDAHAAHCKHGETVTCTNNVCNCVK